MQKFDIVSSLIYKYRYLLGYILIGIILTSILLLISLNIPGALSQSEIDATIKSSAVSLSDLSSFAITNLPYHLLQQASLYIFGVSLFSIKLPSILLALITGVLVLLVLQRWFGKNIAVFAAVIAITTGQFLLIAQTGTPSILYLLWPAALLLLGIQIAHKKSPRLLYKMGFFVVAALSLYTPLSIYVLISLVSTILIHPHLRYFVRQLSRSRVLLGALAAFVLLTPLLASLIKEPSLALVLLGIPNTMPDFLANFSTLGAQYLGFFSPAGTPLMTPIFGLATSILMVFGLYRLFKTRETARSYTISIWLLLLLPVLIVNPNFTSIIFVPSVLLLASGLSALLTYWYDIFPKNPYARISGLIPIIFLASTLILSGLDRYVYGYRYDPVARSGFSRDIVLLPKSTPYLLVSDEELPFYSIVGKHHSITVSSALPDEAPETLIASRAAREAVVGYEISSITVDHTKDQADRFYQYTKTTD